MLYCEYGGLENILRGSWWPCTPFLTGVVDHFIILWKIIRIKVKEFILVFILKCKWKTGIILINIRLFAWTTGGIYVFSKIIFLVLKIQKYFENLLGVQEKKNTFRIKSIKRRDHPISQKWQFRLKICQIKGPFTSKNEEDIVVFLLKPSWIHDNFRHQFSK